MDLSLRGSQINLVVRQKQKPKFASQTNLYNPRPRSASFFSKRSRSTPFLVRPQSADPKFRSEFEVSYSYNSVGGDYQAKYTRKEPNKYQSVSSSDLLKLLLDEPIKRSWLCRGTPAEGASSPDETSEVGSSRRLPSYTSLNKRSRTYSIEGSSVEGDNNSDKHSRTSYYARRPRSASQRGAISKMSNVSMLNSSSSDKKSYGASSDYWHSNEASSKSAKPDLPGRVSFSSVNAVTQDADSSDCDNDRQEQFQHYNSSSSSKKKVDCSISAPGPVTKPQDAGKATNPSYETATDINLAGLKKSVRFGAADGAEVLAETYEYPKCPSDNCSCSTRSSSTASMHDAIETTKCACNMPTCKYNVESEKQTKALELPTLPIAANANAKEQKTPIEDIPVIRDYKNAVGEQLANSVVKNILEEPKSTLTSLNNIELPSYLGKYAASESSLDKQNNLSELSNANTKASLNKTSAKRINELLKNESSFEKTNSSKSSFISSSESVIKNYLKVVATTSQLVNKKQENKPSSAESLNKSSKPKVPAVRSHPATGKLTKKSTSFGSLREDSNLSEFNLDKVDSWMSVNEQSLIRDASEKPRPSYEEVLERLTKDSNDVELETGDTESQISTKSTESSQEDSTYDEIVSVIKEIDEDKKTDNFAERTSKDMELQLDETEREEIPGAAEVKKVDIKEREKSPDKYKDILNYLDNVEDSCDKTLLETRRSIPESNRSEMEFVVEPDIAEDVPKLSDLLMLPNHQLARRIISLSLRANELANAVHLSKEHVMKIRAEKQKSIRSEKSNATSRMREQKKHYEAVVTRHQGFIEQLLKDKGSLCEKVAALTRRLESQNQAWEHKLETEVQRVKETTLAGEKIRRERWVRENTKKIKELTVKGLEMEINKMTCNHQREVTELKRAHQQQLLDAVEEARLKHEQIESTIRESCAQDRESIIEKERMAIRERFERQLEEERKSFDEQKQKLCEEYTAERERLQGELKEKENEYQLKRQEWQREKEHELDETVAELQDKMSKQEEKYQNRINTIEKQFESDFKIWKCEFENSLKMQQVEKENTIRQHYRAERDRQIDDIVSRMDAEALKNAEEFEAKINRLKEKYEKDLHEAESVEKSLREKYADARNRLAESDAQVRNYQAELKQLQMELGHSKKMCNDFLAERDQLRENLRNEIQNEVATLRNERDNEIQKIHKRVQQAIEKKDATIELLQKESGALRERCIKLEAVIRQQRKDYCVK